MTTSDNHKKLCVEIYPDTKIKDWKRISKINNGDIVLRCFENKNIDKYITTFEDTYEYTYIDDEYNDGDDDTIEEDEITFIKAKITTKPSDYVFGLTEKWNNVSAYIQPKWCDEQELYDQGGILSFSIPDKINSLFNEDCESDYSYCPNNDDIPCKDINVLKQILLDLGLEHNPKLDGITGG